MVDSGTALFCGFTPGEFRALQAPLPPLPFRAVVAGSALQVIETSYFALLLADAPLLPEKDTAIRRFFSEVDGESTVKYIVTQNPGIQTKQLARLIGRGQPAVKRYIEELCLAGKNIQYNATTHGWSLKQP